MSESPQSSDDENGTDSRVDVTRRTVLNGAVGTAALALGAGGVAANGKGGQAFVHGDDFREDETFEIVEDSLSDGKKPFTCGRKGRGIPFPYWEFKYEEEDEPKKLYTRDNTIDTSKTYRWTNDKTCDDNYRQVGFAID